MGSKPSFNENEKAWTFNDWVYEEHMLDNDACRLKGAKASYRSKREGRITIRGELPLDDIIKKTEGVSSTCDPDFLVPVKITLNVIDFCKLGDLLERSWTRPNTRPSIHERLGQTICISLFEPIWYLEFRGTKPRGLQANRENIVDFMRKYTPLIYKWVKNQFKLPEAERNPFFESLLQKMRKSNAPELSGRTSFGAKDITAFSIELGIGAELEKVDMRRPLEDSERFIRDYVYRKVKREDYSEGYWTVVGYIKGLFLNSSNQQS